MTSLLIRKAEPRDAASIIQLMAELAATSGEHSSLTPDYVEQYLASPVSQILLAERQGQVVGLLSFSIRPDLFHAGNSCLLEELVVQEQVRGQGVGSALLSELLARLSTGECAEVSLAVMPGNTQALKFYRRHGLTEEAIFLEKHFETGR